MPDITIHVEWACSLEEARSVLSESATLACFPGVSRTRTGGEPGRYRQALELPLIGLRTQVVEISAEEARPSERTTHVVFAARGALLCLSGRWTLEQVVGCVDARLTAGWEVAEEVVGDAINELRSRSPLPIRTDADAILRRAVDDSFDAYFARAFVEYRDRVSGLVAGRP